MRGSRRLLVLSLACLVSAFPLGASGQDAPRVLRVAEFGGDGLEKGEASALKDLVTSYVIELKMFRIIDDSGQELSLKEEETAVQLGVAKDLKPLAADYILSAEANRVGALLVFTMDVTKVTSGEKKNVAEPFSSVNDLILASRRLTRTLFGKPDEGPSPSLTGATTASASAPPPAPRPASNPAPSLGLVAGTWKGDKNVDRVSILPDGRGFAVLASGTRMALKAVIDGGTVVILQDQPNFAGFLPPQLGSEVGADSLRVGEALAMGILSVVGRQKPQRRQGIRLRQCERQGSRFARQ